MMFVTTLLYTNRKSPLINNHPIALLFRRFNRNLIVKLHNTFFVETKIRTKWCPHSVGAQLRVTVSIRLGP